jgi:hypothetical protein
VSLVEGSVTTERDGEVDRVFASFNVASPVLAAARRPAD